MSHWRPRLEETNREARQVGVGVRGGIEQVARKGTSRGKKLGSPHRMLQRVQYS